MGDTDSNYNIKLCRICQISKNLDLVDTSTTTEDGETYLDLLRFIFKDIVWIEDHEISVACTVCLKKIKEVAEFKTLCLESNRRRSELNIDPVKVEDDKIKRESDVDEPNTDEDNDTESASIEATPFTNDTETEVLSERRKTRKRKLRKEYYDEDIEESETKKSRKYNVRRKKIKTTLAKRQVKRKVKKRASSSDNEDNKEKHVKQKKEERNVNDKKSKHEMKKDKDIDDYFQEMALNGADGKMSVYIPQYVPQPLENTCRRCKVKFSGYEELKEHVNTTHLKLRRYHCDTCQEGFISKDLLERHIFKHDGVRTHVCTICGSKYITLGDLKHHLDRHVDVAKFGCDMCEKKYKTQNSLRTHKQLVHVERKDFKHLCPECGKKFPQASALKVHMMRIHENLRSFTCPLCEKTFCTKGEVVTHQKTHTNIREFKCELCPTEYKHKDQLLIHQTKVHGIGNHKIRPAEKYECGYCSKIISSKDKLKRHIRTHTGVKPFRCLLCDMNFTCKTYVRCHVKRKHGVDVDATDFNIKQYCDVCEDAFENEEEVGGNLIRSDTDIPPVLSEHN